MAFLETLQKHNNEKRERDRRLGKFPTAQVVMLEVAKSEPPPVEPDPVVLNQEQIKAMRLDDLRRTLRRLEDEAQQVRDRIGIVTERPGPATATIINVVARYYGATTAQLKSVRREADIVRPRQVAMYLAAKLTERSLPHIGRQFGGRDHTTVLHGKRKIESLIKIDDTLAADIERLIAVLSPAESTDDRVTAQTPAEQRTGD